MPLSLRRASVGAEGIMGTQNIYDNPDFLAGYETLDRQVHGLDGAAEWPQAGLEVVDLGCGFGW